MDDSDDSISRQLDELDREPKPLNHDETSTQGTIVYEDIPTTHKYSFSYWSLPIMTILFIGLMSFIFIRNRCKLIANKSRNVPPGARSV